MKCLLATAVLCLAALPLRAQGLKRNEVKYEGMKLTIVPAGQTFDVEPLQVFHYAWDAVLPAGEPSYRGPVLLPKCAWVFGSLRPGSLVVTAADKPETKFVEGTDYKIDPGLAAVAAVAGSPAAGAKCHFEYDYTRTRLDLIERTADGKHVLKKGVEDKSEPSLPDPSPGATPVIGIYHAPNTIALGPENVNLIDPGYDGVPPVMNAAALKTFKDKVEAGGSATVVFIGDSITAQQPKDFRDGKGSFVDRCAKYAEEKVGAAGWKVVVTPAAAVVPAAEKQFVIVKAGIGGDDSRGGLARIERDVLPHKPDLVVVMFGVNDENRRGAGNSVSVPDYKKNLTAIVGKVRAGGAEPLLMTTSMKNLQWSSCTGKLGEYAAAAREVATEQKCCLVDNYRAWELIPKTGYNYMVYLGTCLNHPIDRGHQLFFEGLKAAFEAD